MDDHSHFLVGYGLHASASSALVLETFRAAKDFKPPEEANRRLREERDSWE
jgi:hypothetical protein